MTPRTTVVGDPSKWRLVAQAALSDEERPKWHAYEAKSPQAAYVGAHRLRGRGRQPVAEPDELIVVTAGEWVFARKLLDGEDPAKVKLPKQVLEWRRDNPSGGRTLWRQMALKARAEPGVWQRATAPSRSSANSAASRFRGAGTAPLGEAGEFDVRIGEDFSVWVRTMTNEEDLNE